MWPFHNQQLGLAPKAIQAKSSELAAEQHQCWKRNRQALLEIPKSFAGYVQHTVFKRAANGWLHVWLVFTASGDAFSFVLLPEFFGVSCFCQTELGVEQ